MNFQRGRSREEPEINLIPLIDVLLVIIIFLMLTTTYAKYSGLEINLPMADGAAASDQPNQIDVTVTAGGETLINKQAVESGDVAALARALQAAAGGRTDPVIVIGADAKAAHQNVVNVMHAAQKAGYPHISFATQSAR